MALNKALAIIICAMLFLSVILIAEPVKAESTLSSSLFSFDLYGWVWSPDYAQYGIGNATLTITNGNITYNPDSPEIWSFYLPDCQLNFTFQPNVIQTYNITLAGSKTRSILQLGEIDYPTRSDFSGVWLESNYTWISGHIALGPVEGGFLNSSSNYYFNMRTRNVSIPLSSSSTDLTAGIESIINNAFLIIEELNNQMYRFRSIISDILRQIVVIFEGIRNNISPYIP